MTGREFLLRAVVTVAVSGLTFLALSVASRLAAADLPVPLSSDFAGSEFRTKAKPDPKPQTCSMRPAGQGTNIMIMACSPAKAKRKP